MSAKKAPRRKAPAPTLTEKQRRFAHFLAADPNQAKAYRRVSPDVTDLTARVEGMRMARKPAVAALVAELRASLLAKFNVTNERIIEEYARIAFLDLAELYGEDGKLLPVHEMPEHARRAVAAIDVDELYDGTGKDRMQVGFTTKLKTWGKRDALFDLAKIRKMVTEKVEHDVSEGLADALALARARAKNR